MLRAALLIAGLGAAWLVGTGPPATAAELVMFEQDYCEWCEAWRREVGVVYDKTAEGRIAPLRRVNIFAKRPADLVHIKGIRFTPTFVVLEDGKEVDRIIGYPGEEMFYGLLGQILAKLGKPAS